jgi:hypothetical protein
MVNPHNAISITRNAFCSIGLPALICSITYLTPENADVYNAGIHRKKMI